MKERIRKMSDMMEEKDKVLSFTMIKIEKGREKICRCSPPHYEIDPVNRVVSCMDCGATLDAFDALLTLCEYMEKFEEYQKEAIKKGRNLQGMGRERMEAEDEEQSIQGNGQLLS